LEYKEINFENGEKYKGYLNQHGQFHGVGILTKRLPIHEVQIGEWLENKLHGIAQIINI
jgi:hypothetical protein